MIKKTKITGLALFIAAFFMQSAYSYAYKLINLTDGDLETTAKYVGETWFSCRADRLIIKPGMTATLKSGLCCLNFIDFGKMNGSKNVRSGTRYTPKNGCQDLQIKIVDMERGIESLPL